MRLISRRSMATDQQYNNIGEPAVVKHASSEQRGTVVEHGPVNYNSRMVT